MWDILSKRCNYDEKVKQFGRGNFKGIGVSFYLHGGGFTGDGEFKIIKSRVKLRKLKDGYVEIFASNVEMGQGVLTTFCKIVAEELGIPLDKVIFKNPDTSSVPDSGPTVASRSVFIVGKLLQSAAVKLKVHGIVVKNVKWKRFINILKVFFGIMTPYKVMHMWIIAMGFV